MPPSEPSSAARPTPLHLSDAAFEMEQGPAALRPRIASVLPFRRAAVYSERLCPRAGGLVFLNRRQLSEKANPKRFGGAKPRDPVPSPTQRRSGGTGSAGPPKRAPMVA